MNYLLNQEEFEQLIGKSKSNEPVPDKSVIYFTASWCGPCQRIDKELLNRSFSNINFLLCDIDRNDYTAGYCGIRKIPTFLVIYKTKIIDTFSSTNTFEIVERVNTIFKDL
jgi:thioredoxin-like negative regulator of GroEL